LNPLNFRIRIIIFIDLQNFELSCKSVNTHYMLDYYKIPQFLIKYVIKKYNLSQYNPRLIRAYACTGEYTDSLMEQLKKYYGDKSDEYKKYLESAKKQKQIEKWFDKSDFFELKLKPLKFRDGEPRQKGVDVQLAVDLVSHAYQDNYDLAIVCSGDADLLDSMNLVKSLGKNVIIVSRISGEQDEATTLAFVMNRYADSVIDLGKLTPEEFKEFTHVYKEYPKTNFQ